MTASSRMIVCADGNLKIAGGDFIGSKGQSGSRSNGCRSIAKIRILETSGDRNTGNMGARRGTASGGTLQSGSDKFNAATLRFLAYSDKTLNPFRNLAVAQGSFNQCKIHQGYLFFRILGRYAHQGESTQAFSFPLSQRWSRTSSKFPAQESGERLDTWTRRLTI